MSKIHINTFMGMVPRYADRKINPNQAKEAVNIDLFSREIRPIKSNLKVVTPAKTGTVLSIYPLNNVWLHWITDVDVVPAPLQTEQDGRIYYSGDKNPKSTDNALCIDGAGAEYPLSFYRLGLPSPETAPTVGITGGASGTPETRDYVYTFMTAWGEEGPPSPVTTFEAAHDDATQWDISGMDLTILNNGVITGAVHSAGVVTVTVSAKHFLETGDYLDIASVVGMTDLNGSFQVTRLTDLTFSVILTTAQTYTSGGTWTRDAPIQTTGLTKNIYRSVLGVFKLVASGITAATYTDTVADADLAEELPSTLWTSPNGNLTGLIDLPNGALAGFFGNVLAFSEPYKPHAWPSDYQITFPYEIVAIASKGNSVFVTTTKVPYLVTGYHPDSMSDSGYEFNHACISKRSMRAVLNGVIYASPDGLAYIPSSGAPYLVTKGWMKKSDWTKYNPASIVGLVHDDRYYAFYQNAGEANNESGGIVFDPEEQDAAFTKLDATVDAGYTDLQTDEMYLVENTSITRFGKGGKFNTYTWNSKTLTTSRPVVLKAGKVKITLGGGVSAADQQAAIDAAVASVQADIDSGIINDNGTFGGYTPAQYTVAGGPFFKEVNPLIANVITATLSLYGDGTLYATKLLSDSKVFTLPVIKKKLVDTWEVVLSGTNVQIHEVTLAETKSELREV